MASDLARLVQAYGQKVLSQVDEIAGREASLMRSDIVEGWPVASVNGGSSRAGWQGPIKVGHAHYQLRNEYPYAATIEFGGYPGVGPKTEKVGAHVLPGGIQIRGGIYPSQKPDAPVARAISKRTIPINEALAKVLRAS